MSRPTVCPCYPHLLPTHEARGSVPYRCASLASLAGPSKPQAPSDSRVARISVFESSGPQLLVDQLRQLEVFEPIDVNHVGVGFEQVGIDTDLVAEALNRRSL